MNAIAKCQQIIADLESKRAALVARAAEIIKERDDVSFAAHAEKARAKLNRLAEEQAKNSNTIATIDVAIKVAKERLADAEHEQALRQRKAAAAAAREAIGRITESMKKVDAAFTEAIDQLNMVDAETIALATLGYEFPNMKPLAETTLKAMLMRLPAAWWRGWVEFLPPNQRKDFSTIWHAMALHSELRIARRLDEPVPVAPPGVTPMPAVDERKESAAAARAFVGPQMGIPGDSGFEERTAPAAWSDPPAA